MKAQLIEMASSKNSTNDELANIKRSHDVESGELRRQLKELTENSEAETRQKNDKIKRLEQEIEATRSQQIERLNQQRADSSSKDK